MNQLSAACQKQALLKTENYNGIDIVRFLCAFLVEVCRIGSF